MSRLKSVPCALLFAALIKIGFVLFKIKLLYLRTENLKFQVESFENQQKIFRIGYKFDQRARTNSLAKKQECSNLLVPVCISVSHVAFCSARVECTWMQLGNSAGIAAAFG